MNVNTERMREIANDIGDSVLVGTLFWSMFDDLSKKKQGLYLKRAEELRKEILNVGRGNPTYK